MIVDRWLFGENTDGERQYLIHTDSPRFIARIYEDHIGGESGTDIEWIDEPELDAAKLSRLMREAGEALNEYDAILFDEEEEE